MFCFIDTAATGCHVAFADNGGILAERSLPIERGHAEALVPLYEDCLRDANRKAQDMTAVYVTIGPGSFTGLRVGLTMARLIGFTLSVQVHGITMFQAFSCGIESKQNRRILIETKRSDFYTALLDHTHNLIDDPACITGEKIMNEGLITGDAVTRFKREMGQGDEDRFIQQDSIHVERVVQAIIGGVLQTTAPDAFYIRDADISQPKKHNF